MADTTDSSGEKKREDLAGLLEGIGRTIEDSIRILGARNNVLNVRVGDGSLQAIDSLIAAGLFKTRSEAAAYLIETGIAAKSEVFETINQTAQRIAELREEMRATLRRSPAPAAATERDPVDPA